MLSKSHCKMLLIYTFYSNSYNRNIFKKLLLDLVSTYKSYINKLYYWKCIYMHIGFNCTFYSIIFKNYK